MSGIPDPTIDPIREGLRQAAAVEELRRKLGDTRESVTVPAIGAEQLTPEQIEQQKQQRLRQMPRVSHGRIVHTNGPWSNGHQEQCAIVTNVMGDGVAPGSFVNLHVFIDADQSITVTHVPWFPTREAALASLLPDRNPVGGPEVCWFPDQN